MRGMIMLLMVGGISFRVIMLMLSLIRRVYRFPVGART
jgi:hypothetical protein